MRSRAWFALLAVLPADDPFTPADAGQHRFPVTLRTGGFQSVEIAAADLPDLVFDTVSSRVTGHPLDVAFNCGSAPGTGEAAASRSPRRW